MPQTSTTGSPSPRCATAAPFKEVESSSKSQLADIWHVVTLNDPVNLMSYVMLVFRRVFGYSPEKARELMLQVHELGRARVWSGERELAETYVHTLQGWQLNAILERDEN